MNKRWIFLLLPLIGCQAHMLETHGDKPSLFASVNEKHQRGGVIRYLNTGMDAWKKARRKDAEKQMNAFCKGPYHLEAEGPRSKLGTSVPIGTSASLEVDQYWYVVFQCQAEAAPAILPMKFETPL